MRGLDQRRSLGLGFAALLLGFAMGCGGGGGEPPADGLAEDNVYLETFAEDYRLYSMRMKRPPRKVEDMKVLETIASPAVAKARDGDIIVMWGAELPDFKEEPGQSTAPEILAYGKDVPEKGGYVLHLDRTITKMTPEEFKAAKLAGSGGADSDDEKAK